MPDRTLNWGDPADAGTKYRTQDDDPAGGGNFVVAEDTDNNTVLLQYNPTASQWEYAGPVDMGSNDISNVGTISTNALEAAEISKDESFSVLYNDSQQTIQNSTITQLEFNNTDGDDLNVADLANNQAVIQKDGDYAIQLYATWESDAGWTTGDRAEFESINANVDLHGPNAQPKISSSQQLIKTPAYPVTMQSGQTITANLFQDSGADKNLTASDVSPARTNGLIIRRIG